MNRKQLQYVIELSEDLNFSVVAERLGITQPALSKQILSLEKELDVKLFDRNNIPMTLTAAGEHFVAEAKKLIYREDQLVRSMEDYKSGKLGKLEIGISPFRSLYLIPNIVNKVKDKFPGVTVVLHEEGSDTLRKNAAEGKYDFAVVNLPVDESVLDVTLIEADTLVLAVPEKLAETPPEAAKSSIPEIDLKDCKKLPSVVVSTIDKMAMLGTTNEFKMLLGRVKRRCPVHGFSATSRCIVKNCECRAIYTQQRQQGEPDSNCAAFAECSGL